MPRSYPQLPGVWYNNNGMAAAVAAAARFAAALAATPAAARGARSTAGPGTGGRAAGPARWTGPARDGRARAYGRGLVSSRRRDEAPATDERACEHGGGLPVPALSLFDQIRITQSELGIVSAVTEVRTHSCTFTGHLAHQNDA